MLSENIWQHYKGGKYTIQGFANIEADLTPAVIYRSVETGALWVRPCEEFFDGRFVLTGTAVPDG